MTGPGLDQKLANFQTRHYGAGYVSKIPAELCTHVPSGLYHFEVVPHYRKSTEAGIPLRTVSVKADLELRAWREAYKQARLSTVEGLRLVRVEPNPEYLEYRAKLAQYI